MSSEREVRKERDFWGDDREFIYEDNRKVGEVKTEERGGFFGLGGESVRVEYDTDGHERSYTKQEERGGFFGVGAESVEVRYDTSDNEVGHSKVEERGGDFLLGIGAHHVRVEYDEDGRELSQTNTEQRHGFFGVGGQRVRVTRYSQDNPAQTERTRVKDQQSLRASDTSASSGFYATASAAPTAIANKPSSGAFAFIVLTALTIIAFIAIDKFTIPSFQDSKLVTRSSIGPIRLGMTLDQAKRALPGAALERATDGDGVALVAVKIDGADHFFLFAEETDPQAPIQWSARISLMETFHPSYHTTDGVHPDSPVADVERVFGHVVEISKSEIESREYISFAGQPPGLTFRLNYSGIFSADSRETKMFKSNARIFGIQTEYQAARSN